VIEGISAARAPWVVVMDGDLQHPPEDVPRLMAVAGRAQHDVVAASRYCKGGATDGLSGGFRRFISSGSIRAARALFPRRLADCSDTMTGFFAVRRSALDLAGLRPRGFKVLLEILGRHQLRVAEVPFEFAERHSGTSKASLGQGLSFLTQLARLRIDSWAAANVRRSMAFAATGIVALVLDVAVFNLLLATTRHPVTDKLLSAAVAVIASYFLNKHWAWRDRPKARTVRGLATFAVLSFVGVAIAEVCLVISHYGLGLRSALDDNVSANLIGLGLGMLWRYWSYNKWAFPITGVLPSIPAPPAARLSNPLAVPDAVPAD
jgi:dolichol-phosphate mannosyltransferase